MAVYRRSARPRFTLLLLVVTAVTLLTLDERGARVVDSVRGAARDAFAPITSAADAVFEPVGDVVQGIVHYGDLEAENARLREQLASRDGEQLKAQDAQRELKALLDQQELAYIGDIPTVAARVVTLSPNNFELTLEIDRGTGDGVVQGMPVVSGAGLVGRVVEASRTRSTVLLITDAESSVGVRLVSSGDIGVANGQGERSPLGVDLIDPATVVPPDEVVVTSGLQQSVFPPGIPVGKVRSATARPGELQQEVTVDPVVDLSRLTFVKVLQWSPRAA
ncbi:MAG TPA: rod shape-determining protein MreC [Acidimicrobiales bacterium]|nr:rod shape-determining protein MreC [Acidimicrobiales bacterium]